ncbi:hypothetical protein QCA50_016365 [Cerrena zonata]|uniref:Uncharacterized protein n=1 Tax=Cerrena zonata TaxID=2478898 RepID=A0AAW0FSR5_9APHY
MTSYYGDHSAASEQKPSTSPQRTKPASSRKKASPVRTRRSTKTTEEAGDKREVDEFEKDTEGEGPPAKKIKGNNADEATDGKKGNEIDHPAKHVFQEGTIERGHIYFFYRPKVELEEAHSLDDVQRFHILLVPRPPEFASDPGATDDPSDHSKVEEDDEKQMNILAPGADAVPAPESTNVKKKPFRLVAVGKKSLPDPDSGGGGKGGGRKQIFWATITTVGDDLQKLEAGLGRKEYETKTRGTRHQGPARLAGRGAYAIVNTQHGPPSSRETHLGYHLSHPDPEHFGKVQKVLGIHEASSFVVQVKNPLAPNTGSTRVGLSGSNTADFPDYLMKEVFGYGKDAEHSKGREDYGLRFASVERKELLDYEGVELLFIAARNGEQGLETSLGEGRGEALREVEKKESQGSINTVLKELALHSEKIPAEPLNGEWI